MPYGPDRPDRLTLIGSIIVSIIVYQSRYSIRPQKKVDTLKQLQLDCGEIDSRTI